MSIQRLSVLADKYGVDRQALSHVIFYVWPGALSLHGDELHAEEAHVVQIIQHCRMSRGQHAALALPRSDRGDGKNDIATIEAHAETVREGEPVVRIQDHPPVQRRRRTRTPRSIE